MLVLVGLHLTSENVPSEPHLANLVPGGGQHFSTEPLLFQVETLSSQYVFLVSSALDILIDILDCFSWFKLLLKKIDTLFQL